MDIEFAEENKQKADEQTEIVGSIEKKVRSCLQNLGLTYLNLSSHHFIYLALVSILVEKDQQHKPTLTILSSCKTAIDEILQRIAQEGETVEYLLSAMEESDFKPEGLPVDDSFKLVSLMFRIMPNIIISVVGRMRKEEGKKL